MRTNLHDVRRLWTLVTTAVLALTITACSSTSSIQGSGDPRIDRVLEEAYELEGTPYCYSGASPDCFDCSGFVNYCYAVVGLELPRTSRDLYRTGSRVIDGLRHGDLVFFNTSGRGVSHVGIYVGNNRFIHSSSSNGVMVSSLADRYWQPRYLGARRVSN